MYMSLEKWKQIVGYNDYYVSNYGRVKSTKRKNAIILNGRDDGKGYLKVALYDSDGKAKELRISRLVAEHFINNKYNKEQVNHINGDKQDNRVCNLEWVTNLENTRHSFEHLDRASKMPTKKVAKVDLQDNIIIKYESIKDASICEGVHRQSISNTLRGISKSLKGYKWIYLN